VVIAVVKKLNETPQPGRRLAGSGIPEHDIGALTGLSVEQVRILAGAMERDDDA
jgi:hypothetical protein